MLGLNKLMIEEQLVRALTTLQAAFSYIRVIITNEKGEDRMTENIVQVRDLTMAYHDKPVLWDVDLDIPKGSRTAIIGPNGAGKSTLIKGYWV